MAALGFHWPEKDVAVAAGDDCEIGSGLEFVTGSDPLRNHDLTFDRESRRHLVGFSYCNELSRMEQACTRPCVHAGKERSRKCPVKPPGGDTRSTTAIGATGGTRKIGLVLCVYLQPDQKSDAPRSLYRTLSQDVCEPFSHC